MNDRTSSTADRAWASAATPRASPRLRGLIDRAIKQADLSDVDVLSLGDWVAMLDDPGAERLGVILIALFLAVADGSLAIELSAESLARRLEGLAGELES